MLAIGGGGLADAAADKLLEHELAIRLKERSAARELERAVRERAELAALRDGAKERRELLLLEMRSSGGAAGGADAAAAHEAELREIDDEAESLEAQLEVKSARIAEAQASKRRDEHTGSSSLWDRGDRAAGAGEAGAAFAEIEPRLLAERLFDKVVDTRMQQQAMRSRANPHPNHAPDPDPVSGPEPEPKPGARPKQAMRSRMQQMKLERDAIAEALSAQQQQQQQQQAQ